MSDQSMLFGVLCGCVLIGLSAIHGQTTETDIKKDKVTEIAACPGPKNYIRRPYSNNLFKTPNYPNRLTSNLECEWRFSKSSDYANTMHLYLEFEELNLPCNSSTKLFVSGDAVYDQLCDIESYSQYFPADFKINLIGGKDDLEEGIQFRVTSKELPYVESCNQTHYVFKSKGLNVSLTMRFRQYLVPLNCFMMFQTFPTKQLAFTVEKLALSPQYNHSECDDNHLVIYDGPSRQNQTLLDACYLPVERRMISSGNEIMVEIKFGQYLPVDSDVQININLEMKAMSCNGRTIQLRAFEYGNYLSSPNYPLDYESNSNCTWSIKSRYHPIEVAFIYLQMEESDNCAKDSVDIYDPNISMNKPIAKVCGTMKERYKFRSRGQSLIIKFKTDGGKNGEGFQLMYRSKRTPSAGLTNDGFDSSNSGESEESGPNTGVIIGTCLAILVGHSNEFRLSAIF